MSQNSRAKDEQQQALAIAHMDFSDFVFEEWPDSDDQDSRTRDFETQFFKDGAEFDDRHHAAGRGFAADDTIDAEHEDIGEDGAPIPGTGNWQEEKVPQPLKAYLAELKNWKGEGDQNKDKNEFVNSANLVDESREKRLRYAREIMENPELITDPRLGADAKYLHADLAYIARSDPSSGDYGEFMQRRAELRDQMFQGTPMLSADDYAKVAGRAQRMIADETHIDFQYDMIDLRKEAALEHFNDPRFIAEVYKDRRGLMDELLVDFDRKDLLASAMKENSTTSGRSAAMAEIFDESVRNKKADSKDLENVFSSDAEMVRSFQKSREVGLNIRHNQRAITGFVDKYPNGGVAYERGMAALDNVRWSDSLWSEYGLKLPKEHQKFISKHKGPASAFVVARKQFADQFSRGDPRMAKSFAVMERAAAKLEMSPKGQESLAKIGGAEDLASFHIFTEKYREKNLGKVVTDEVDDAILTKMGPEGTSTLIESGNVLRRGSLTREGDAGDEYALKIGKDTAIDVVDGAHVRVANSEKDLHDGKGVVMRLEGIIAPPEGVSTKSGKLDAGLEAKANLEGVIKRHGVASLGMTISRSDKGEETIHLRTSDGEDMSQRMLRDGYAIPTKDSVEGDRREYMAKQAEANGRGLWKDGFPDMDQSWRREKNAPELTWREKRMHLEKTVNGAICHTHMEVARNLSRSETKLFALPVKRFAGSSLVDREISKVIDRNPTRIMDIYNENMGVLEDLRKRKDKLSQPEKQAHDQLALGRRALGEALVSRNLLDEKQFKKDSHDLMSRKGIKISAEGIRKVADATGKVAEAAGRGAVKAGRKAKGITDWILDEAMS